MATQNGGTGPDCESRRQKVIQTITAAFDGVSRGYGITLHEAEAMDSYASYEERDAARLLDTDRCWQEVPVSFLQACPFAIYFLCPAGFRYYLPVYLIGLLEHPEAVNVSSILSSLVPTGRKSDRLPERAEGLSAEQARAVCLFLWYLVDCGERYFVDDEVVEALSRYWGRFCPS